MGIFFIAFWNRGEGRLRAGWRVLAQMIMFLFIAIFLEIAFQWLSGSRSPSGLSSFFPGYLAIILSVWLCGRIFDRRTFREFGFKRAAAWWVEFGLGCLLGLTLMAGIFFFQWAMGWLRVVDSFQTAPDGSGFWVNAFSLLAFFFIVSLSEELFSRGYHIKNLAEGLRLPALGENGALLLAALLSSTLFGVLHGANSNATWISVTYLILAGLLLAAGYLWTGRLGLPIGLHLAWNYGQGVVFGFPVSGESALFNTRFIAIENLGPQLWTGGEFGPEAGLLGLVAYPIGIFAIAVWSHKRKGTWQFAAGLALPPARQAERQAIRVGTGRRRQRR